MNRTDYKRRIYEQAEENQPTINSIIFQIADSAYCNGYNHVLNAAEKVLDTETYNRLIKELAKMELKEEAE